MEEDVRIQREEISEFDKRGNIIKQYFKYRLDKEMKMSSIIESKYTKKNIIKQELVIHPNEQTIKTLFDAYGNQISKRIYDNDNNLVSEKKYDAEYDYHHNFTKVVIQKDGVIQEIIKREIRYY